MSYWSTAEYEGGKRALDTERDTDLARNAYARFLSQQRGERNVQKVGEDWGKRWQGIVQSFGKRGMLQSGQYRRGLGDAATNRLRDTDDTRLAWQASMRQHDDTDASIQAAYQRALADLQLKMSMAQQQAAAQLQALKG
jgi:hypothetical protein